jgi:hypothetical protein
MSLYYDSEEEKLLYENLNKICTERRILELAKVDPKREEKERVSATILKFIKDKERIIYGGQSYHVLITEKSKKDFIYTDLDYPDVEFYTPQMKQDIIELCQILKDEGFQDIMAEEGVHPTTFRVNINLETYCDVSYYPQKFYESIPFTVINGYKYAQVPFMYIDILKIYSYPINNFFRLTKTFKRANLLIKHYPINYNTHKVSEIHNNNNEFVVKIIKKMSSIIITDVAAHNIYLEESGEDSYEKKVLSIPYYVVVSVNYLEDVNSIKEELEKKFNNMKTRSFYNILDYIGERTDFYIPYKEKKSILIQIYEEKNNCIPYYEKNGLKYSTIQSTLYYLFVIRQKLVMDHNSNNNNKEKIAVKETMIQNIIDAKRHYFKKQPKEKMFEPGPFQEFVVKCTGDPIPSMRLAKQVIIDRKSKNRPLKYRYNPNESNNNNFEKMIVRSHTGEEIKDRESE